MLTNNELREYTIEVEGMGTVGRMRSSSAAEAVRGWKNNCGWDHPGVETGQRAVSATIIPLVYYVPSDPAESTICEGCE